MNRWWKWKIIIIIKRVKNRLKCPESTVLWTRNCVASKDLSTENFSEIKVQFSILAVHWGDRQPRALGPEPLGASQKSFKVLLWRAFRDGIFYWNGRHQKRVGVIFSQVCKFLLMKKVFKSTQSEADSFLYFLEFQFQHSRCLVETLWCSQHFKTDTASLYHSLSFFKNSLSPFY